MLFPPVEIIHVPAGRRRGTLRRKPGAPRKIGQILERTLCGAAGERTIGGTGIELQPQDERAALGGVEIHGSGCGIGRGRTLLRR
jgi:hypothetical protein